MKFCDMVASFAGIGLMEDDGLGCGSGDLHQFSPFFKAFQIEADDFSLGVLDEIVEVVNLIENKFIPHAYDL